MTEGILFMLAIFFDGQRCFVEQHVSEFAPSARRQSKTCARTKTISTYDLDSLRLPRQINVTIWFCVPGHEKSLHHRAVA
jgi:hypothetical protein